MGQGLDPVSRDIAHTAQVGVNDGKTEIKGLIDNMRATQTNTSDVGGQNATSTSLNIIELGNQLGDISDRSTLYTSMAKKNKEIESQGVNKAMQG